MLGGYQILNLGSIDLSRAITESSITDVEVLKQLSQIADHIQKNYDFSKPLQNQLKPVLIRYRDKKVGEKHEVACYGNIEVINTYYKFRIVANNEGEQLTINVEFEEKTDEYDNKYWSIKTAKVLLTSAQPIFEEITDKDGNKRFIEGDVNLDQDYEGVTKLYGKWSLSGSHLLIVCCLLVEVDKVLTYGECITMNIPKWIYDKITPIYASAIDKKNFSAFTPNGSEQSVASYLLKKGTGVLSIETGFTATDNDRTIRYSYDLLIDNESQD